MARRTPAARASPSYRPRSSAKSPRGPISHPIPIPSALEEFFLLTPRPANFFVPVTKIDTSNCEADDLGDAQPSFAPAGGHSSPAAHAFPSSFGDDSTRFSGHWPGPPRPELTMPSTLQPTPPPRSEFRDSIDSDCPSQHKKSTIRSAINQLFGRKRSGGEETQEFATQPPEVWSHHPASIGRSLEYTHPGAQRTPVSPITQYNEAHSVESEDSHNFQPSESARNSLFRNQSSASTTTSDPMSPTWNGPTALKPRPAGSQNWNNRYVEANDLVDDAARFIKESQQRLSPRHQANQADDERQVSISSTIWFQPKFVGPNDSEHSAAQTTARPTTHETFDNSVWQFDFQDPPGEPETRITDIADLRTRMGAIEDQLGRVEALLTQVYTVIPKCQPRLGYEDYLMPDPLSLNVQQAFNPSTTRSSSNYSTSSSSVEAASTLVEPTSASILQDSIEVPVFHGNRASSFTLGHYTTLMALIESDRTTRMALESEVKELSQQVKLLHEEPPFHIERSLGFNGDFGFAGPQRGQGMHDIEAAMYIRELSA